MKEYSTSETVVMALSITAVLITPLFGNRVRRIVCWYIGAHDYADTHKYGVQPVCLICKKKRGEQ